MHVFYFMGTGPLSAVQQGKFSLTCLHTCSSAKACLRPTGQSWKPEPYLTTSHVMVSSAPNSLRSAKQPFSGK